MEKKETLKYTHNMYIPGYVCAQLVFFNITYNNKQLPGYSSTGTLSHNILLVMTGYLTRNSVGGYFYSVLTVLPFQSVIQSQTNSTFGVSWQRTLRLITLVTTTPTVAYYSQVWDRFWHKSVTNKINLYLFGSW